MILYNLVRKYGRVLLLFISLIVMVSGYFIFKSKYQEYYDKSYQEEYSTLSKGEDLSKAEVKNAVMLLSSDIAENKTSKRAAAEASYVGYVYIYILITIASLCCLALPLLVKLPDVKSVAIVGAGVVIIGITLGLGLYKSLHGGSAGMWLITSVVLMIGALIAVPKIYDFDNKAILMKVALGMGVLMAIMAISWGMSDAASKLSGTIIYSAIGILIVAAIGLVVSEVRGAMKS